MQELVHSQQFYHWLYYRQNRLKEALSKQEHEEIPNSLVNVVSHGEV